MDQNQWRSAALRLNFHQRCIGTNCRRIAQDRRELFNRWSVKDRGNRKFPAKPLLDLCDQAKRKERVASQFEKLVLSANGPNCKYFLPDMLQLTFKVVLRWRVLRFTDKAGFWGRQSSLINFTVRR